MNISCDVMSNPPATMLWRRERFTISEVTPNMQIHRAEGRSVLEVSSWPSAVHMLLFGVAKEKKSSPIRVFTTQLLATSLFR